MVDLEILVDCANCGKQNLWDKDPEENCLYCGLPLKRKVSVETKEEVKTRVAQRLRGGKRLNKNAEYYQVHKEEMIADHRAMRLVDFFDKWHLASNTWLRLKKEWDVPPKYGRTSDIASAATPRRPYQKGEKFYLRYPNLLHPGARKLDRLPRSPDYWEGYRQAVLDGAPRIIMKEE